MSDSKKDIKVDESYVSFKNINCFENACVVVDNLLRLLENPENQNEYWQKFVSRLPDAYRTRNPEDDPSETLLYLVCSNVPYIIEFFEDVDDEEAIHALQKGEQECC